MKLGLFKTVCGEHLLVAIHHLVVDGVSWRILLEDIRTAYEQVLDGKEIELQGKTESFKDWSEKLLEYSKGGKLLKEKEYWKSIYEKQVEEIYIDNVVERNNFV